MSLPKAHLRCPICSKAPDYSKILNILSDAMALRDNRPYNPADPVIVSKREIYCSADYYVIAVIRGVEQ